MFTGLLLDLGDVKHTQELLSAFEAEAQRTNRPRLMLTAAVSASKRTIDSGYEVPQIGR